jgi:hypothetical protein
MTGANERPPWQLAIGAAAAAAGWPRARIGLRRRRQGRRLRRGEAAAQERILKRDVVDDMDRVAAP